MSNQPIMQAFYLEVNVLDTVNHYVIDFGSNYILNMYFLAYK